MRDVIGKSMFMVWVFSLAVAGLGQATYRIAKGHLLIGHARVSQRITASGGKFTELVMDFKRNGQELEVRTESTLDPSGAPVRQVETVTPEGKPPLVQYIVTYDAKGAHVVTKSPDGPKNAYIQASEGSVFGDPSQFWFLKTRPKLGESCTNEVFTPDTMTWQRSETTFVGEIDGRHRIKTVIGDRTVDTYLDDTGYIIRLTDSTGFRMVRDR